MSSYSRQQLESWLKTIDVKADKVLDVGGSQLPIKGRTKSWEVKEYKILDLEQPHETKQKPDIICNIQEHSDMYKHYNYNKDRFDIIFCIEVSEYWYNPFGALDNIQFLMKPGGLLYISFHFIYPIHKPTEQDYLRYTSNGAARLLLEAGFMIDEFKSRYMTQSLATRWNNFVIGEGMKAAYSSDVVGCLVKAIKK